MKQQSLNGVWKYRIGYGKWGETTVPFSRHPVGHSEAELTFDCAGKGEKVFLRMEGVTYSAAITLNGVHVGNMKAYVEETFDVTGIIRPTGNCLRVELEDISPVFGPSEGWENFGGIIRGVSLLYSGESYLEDVFFHSVLKNSYRDADFFVEISSASRDTDRYRVTLSYGGKTVFEAERGVKDPAAAWSLSDVHLWDPDHPELYRLRVSLLRGKTVLDSHVYDVGFREFSCERHRFLLNGQPIFLKGVCKHEMIGTSGHCPTPAQIEKDLRMIKRTGCNFVRLVHYPHCKETLAIADRLGLMVSEEPGLWWADTANPEIMEGSLTVLRKTIFRDRNHPSIIFWLCFNECRFTEQYLIESAKTCRAADPTRLVSGANCMSDQDTLKYYNLCGFDFYTMHPYSQTSYRASESAAVLHDKPLVFTEWGGHFLYDNPKLLGEFIRELIRLWRNNSDTGALAGASFWEWAEVNDFNRDAPACRDGVLKEGLVTFDRKPNLIYETFRETWKELDRLDDPKDRFYWEPCGKLPAGVKPMTWEDPAFDPEKTLTEAMLPVPERLSRERPHKLKVGPILRDIPEKGFFAQPAVLRDGETLRFSAAGTGNHLILLGAVSIVKGYPLAGEYGEEVLRVRVVCDDGSREIRTLRNGADICTLFTTLSSSRIEPVAENAVPFAHFGYDKNRENYLMNRLDITLPAEKKITNVTLESSGNGYSVLFYAVFVGK